MVFMFFLFFLSAYPVDAANLFDSWVVNNQTITIDGKDYRAVTASEVLILYENNATGKIVLVRNSSTLVDDLLFTNADTKTTISDYLDKHEISGIHTKEQDVYMHKLVVKKMEQVIKLTRNTDPKKPYLFDDFKVLIDIENTGDDDIIGAVYNEKVASFLKLISIRETTSDKEIQVLSPFEINWKFNIKEDEKLKLECTYQFIGLTGNKKFMLPQAKANYVSYGTAMTTQLDSKELDVLYPLEIDFSSDPSSIGYNDKFDYTIDFVNAHSSKSFLVDQAVIIFPPGIYVDSFPDSFKKIDDKSYDNKYVLQSQVNIPYSETVSYDFKLISDAFEKDNVSVDVVYSFVNVGLENSFTKEIKPSFAQPSLDIEVRGKDGDTIRGGDLVEIEFTVTNNHKAEIDEAKISIYSELFDSYNYIFKYVPPKNHASRGRLTKTFTTRLPSLDKAKSIKFYLNATYLSLYGAKSSFSISKSVSVKEGISEKIFDIGGDSVYANGTYNLTLDLKKLTSDAIDSLDVEISAGDHQESHTLSDDELDGLKSAGKSKVFLVVFEDDRESDLDVRVSSDMVVDGREMRQEEIFVLNRSSLIKAIDMKAQSNQSSSEDEQPLQQQENNASSQPNTMEFNVSAQNIFITVGVILGIVAVFMLVKNIKSKGPSIVPRLGMGKKKKKDQYQRAMDLYEEKSFDEAQNIDLKATQDMQDMQSKFIPKSGSGIDALESYINKSISQGRSKSEIRSDLKAHGWLDDVIDIFLK